MSLESLRKLRAQTVESLMMELAKITRALARSEERYRDIETQIQKDVAVYDRQSAQGLTIEAWWEWQGSMDSQQAALRQARLEIDQAVEAWRHTKALLVEASQERKLLDRVADKRRETQRAEAGRQEQRTTDEAASRRYSARKDSNP
ncbi:flagellar export protein FliJ [Nitrospira sp. BLG_2]|uniref:flagellar export protein FliJ n=1 Tax=Nitrospira sp. BLG_2 TaxID=3397507 RepID=UPI003B9ABD8A